MANANLAAPNSIDPNDPRQKQLGGPVQNIPQWPVFRNFGDFSANPMAQDRVAAMVTSGTPMPPSASMQASMQAQGVPMRQPFGTPPPFTPLAPGSQLPAQLSSPSASQSVAPTALPTGPQPSPEPVQQPASVHDALARAAGLAVVPTLPTAAPLATTGAQNTSANPGSGDTLQSRLAQAAGLPNFDQLYQQWQQKNPNLQAKPDWKGASFGHKLLDVLRIAAGGLAGGPLGAVEMAEGMRQHDLPSSLDAIDRQRFQQSMVDPMNNAVTLQSRLAEIANTQANTAHTNLETQQLQMVPPWQKNLQQLQDDLQQRWQQADMSPQDYNRWAQLQISQSPYGSRLDPTYLQQVMQLPRKTTSVVSDKDDIPTAVKYYNQVVPIATDNNGQPLGYQINGNTVSFNDPSLPAELKQVAPEVMQNYRSYQAKRAAKRQDEGYVAQLGAQRQAAGFAQAEHMSELHEDQKQLDQGRQAYFKATSDFNTKKGEVDSIKQNVAMAMDPKNPNPYASAATALSLVGVSLPPGTKRMTDTELRQFQNQGSVGQRLAAALNGYVVGTKMTPQQAKAISDYADAKLAQHTKEFNDTAANIQNIYGYTPPAQKASAQTTSSNSIPASAAAQLREGVEHTFRNGQVWTKKSGKPVRVR